MLKVFHVQCDLNAHIAITKDTLIGEHIYVCRNAEEWLPNEKLDATNAIYELGFNIPEEKIFKVDIWDDFCLTTPPTDTDSSNERFANSLLTDEALGIFDKGYEAIELVSDNDRGELSEILVKCTKKNIAYVKLIRLFK